MNTGIEHYQYDLSWENYGFFAPLPVFPLACLLSVPGWFAPSDVALRQCIERPYTWNTVIALQYDETPGTGLKYYTPIWAIWRTSADS